MNQPVGAKAVAVRPGDFQVMTLVSFAHATSHFFHLVIPSLFPWLMADFGLSFTRDDELDAFGIGIEGWWTFCRVERCNAAAGSRTHVN